jgi:hypothetical protein
MGDTHITLSEHLRKIGTKGGRSKSPAKMAALERNRVLAHIARSGSPGKWSRRAKELGIDVPESLRP